jgi:predicted house-cleaning noncanonical NTP pyrophosphatase (MazG superfamily)
MVSKSALRATIQEVFEEHDIDDTDLEDNLLDRLVQDIAEVFDDEDGEEPDLLGG